MKRILTTFLLALGASALPLHAQGPGGPNSAANAALVQLFGRNTSFSAQSEIQMTPQAGSPRVPGAGGGPVTMTASTAVSQGNVRTEVDMTTMKGGQFPPQALAGLKSMGMDRVVTIVRSEKKLMWIVYPSLSGYVEMPMPSQEAELATADLKIERTELGRETVAGQETIKQKVVMLDRDGKMVNELTVWTAPSLKDLPVQVEMIEGGNLVRITYTDVKLEKPAAALFEPPAGFQKHADLMALMQSGAARMMKPPGQ